MFVSHNGSGNRVALVMRRFVLFAMAGYFSCRENTGPVLSQLGAVLFCRSVVCWCVSCQKMEVPKCRGGYAQVVLLLCSVLLVGGKWHCRGQDGFDIPAGIASCPLGDGLIPGGESFLPQWGILGFPPGCHAVW